MWTEPIPSASQFKLQFRDTFQKLSCVGRVIRVPKNHTLYTSGEQDPTVYLLESGRIKLSVPSPEGKECVMGIRTAGDIFGELTLAGQTIRFETAVAMEEATVKQVFYRNFLAHLKRESLLESLVQYLATRIAEQQELITSLTTMNSERRLARILLQLSSSLGRNQSCGTCITQRISQNELAKMVGTTRTRIGIFLKKFRDLGLLHMAMDRCLVLEESRLSEFLIGYGLHAMGPNHVPRDRDAPLSGPLAIADHSCGKRCIPTRVRL